VPPTESTDDAVNFPGPTERPKYPRRATTEPPTEEESPRYRPTERPKSGSKKPSTEDDPDIWPELPEGWIPSPGPLLKKIQKCCAKKIHPMPWQKNMCAWFKLLGFGLLATVEEHHNKESRKQERYYEDSYDEVYSE
jgi:hypothetical protein